MIVLYKVVPDPSGPCGEHGQLAVDCQRLQRWWGTREEAELAARAFCADLGERPCPGIQHTRPLPVIVVEILFATAVDVANGVASQRQEVARVWSLADGTCSGAYKRVQDRDNGHYDSVPHSSCTLNPTSCDCECEACLRDWNKAGRPGPSTFAIPDWAARGKSHAGWDVNGRIE